MITTWRKLKTTRIGCVAVGALWTTAVFLGLLAAVGLDNNTDVAEINWRVIFFLCVAIGLARGFYEWLVIKNPELRRKGLL